MNVSLIDFPTSVAKTFSKGETVVGIVRFEAVTAATYSSLGYQVIIDNAKGGAQVTEVVRSVTLASDVTFAAGESKDFPITYSVMDVSYYTGKLFNIHPGLRGFARPAKRGSVALHYPPDFYHTSTSWLYSILSSPFRPKGVLNMDLVIDNDISKDFLLPLGWVGSIALFSIPPYGFILLLFMWSAIGFYYVNGVDYKHHFVAPTVQLEIRQKTLLAFISFTTPPKGITKLTAGYEVRELLHETVKREEQVNRQLVLPLEPRQTIDLNKEGAGIAEHQILNLPIPGRWNDYGFEWVYQVRATVGKKTWLWEGVMEPDKK